MACISFNALYSFNPILPTSQSGRLILCRAAPSVRCCAQPDQNPSHSQAHIQSHQQDFKPNNNTNEVEKKERRKIQAESTDWIASSLTRRFGLGAGLAWFGFLAFGVISEQIKTRLEVSQEQQNVREVESTQEVTFPNGIKYVDLRVGGGSSPRRGDLVVVDLKGKVQSTGYVFVDTFSSRKSSLAFLFGIRPYTKGICDGLEYVIKTMKTGGKRRAVIPPELGFGKTGGVLNGDILIPPDATLEYIVELQKVSIPPS